jgi:very-short-patch-repair endonuclease
VDVIAARKARLRPGIRVHRTARLPADDVWERRGIRVTSPVRTLLDLATVLPRLELERAVEQAEILRLLTRTQLEPRARGLLRRILADAHEPAFTRSEAEARLLALIRKARLPAPETNVRIGGYEVDFVWREQKLVVEVDGFAYHSTREAFERDRRKDADLRALGLRTTRITYRQIAHEAEATIASIASLSMQEVHA